LKFSSLNKYRQGHFASSSAIAISPGPEPKRFHFEFEVGPKGFVLTRLATAIN
jgi:hypothetical protein